MNKIDTLLNKISNFGDKKLPEIARSGQEFQIAFRLYPEYSGQLPTPGPEAIRLEITEQ